MKCLLFFFSPKFYIYWLPVNTDFGMPLRANLHQADKVARPSKEDITLVEIDVNVNFIQ